MSGKVVIVGAGVVGASTAYFLAQRGFDVEVIEGREPAWGASGRNPGFVWLHMRAEGTQMELALAGRRLYDQLIQELDDFEFRPSGGMIYFFEHQADLFPAFVQNRVAAGLPMELLDAAAAREVCEVLPPSIAGATYNPLDAHVHPTRLVEALSAAAQRAGARFTHATPVAELDVSDGRCRGVVTADGRSEADIVVLAGGVWTGRLLEPHGLRIPLVPMRLQVMETEPADVRFRPILYGPTAIKQYDFTKQLPGYSADDFTHPLEATVPGVELLELVAQRRDGRVLLGCPMDFPDFDDRTTVAGIGLTLAVLSDHLPFIRSLPLARSWAGLLPETPDALPILGPVEGLDGLVLATGHVFGMSGGAISGKLLAQHLAGEPTDLDLSPFRFERESLGELAAAHRRW
ncbi:MAG TPA: FAD-binding oxidoreductase [Actinomycetota bacterium]|nr:FAD-binding oxidoreductase [Actinomycetota bacterium]